MMAYPSGANDSIGNPRLPAVYSGSDISRAFQFFSFSKPSQISSLSVSSPIVAYIQVKCDTERRAN